MCAGVIAEEQRDLVQGLRHPRLVVHVHHAHEEGVVPTGIGDLCGVNAPGSARDHLCHLEAALLELGQRLEDGLVLESRSSRCAGLPSPPSQPPVPGSPGSRSRSLRS